MQNRVQSAKKPRGLFTFGWSLLCWPSYRDTLFMGLARKAATSSCLVLFIHRVTMEVPRPHSFAYSHIQGGFFRDLICLPPLTWPGFGRKFWDEILEWMWDANWFMCMVKDFLGAVWILSWCKQGQVEQWDTCCDSKNIFSRVNLGKSRAIKRISSQTLAAVWKE